MAFFLPYSYSSTFDNLAFCTARHAELSPVSHHYMDNIKDRECPSPGDRRPSARRCCSFASHHVYPYTNSICSLSLSLAPHTPTCDCCVGAGHNADSAPETRHGALGSPHSIPIPVRTGYTNRPTIRPSVCPPCFHQSVVSLLENKRRPTTSMYRRNTKLHFSRTFPLITVASSSITHHWPSTAPGTPGP